MTRLQSPSAWVAAVDCFGRYLGFFLIAVVVAIVLGVLLAPELGVFVFLGLQAIAITVASYQATKAYDVKCIDGGEPVSGFALGFRFWVALALPWVFLVFAIAPLLPDTMAGGYVFWGVAVSSAVIGPISALVAAPIGVFMAR